LESVYQKALAHECWKAGLRFERERPVRVCYDGVVAGDFAADMLVQGLVMVETKAAHALAPAHEVQLVNHLTATGVEIGRLLNFGAGKLEFKRKHRPYRPRQESKE
jgi:GxxExxY protein